ncbi:MAG: SDR family oxidoreductase [Hymenobacter sp.]|nr:MAG: SDR family oxidoreductase [Hymenobacter sp.]
MSKIMVTGATGRLGKQVVEALLEKTDARNISILVRERSKAEKLQAQGVNVFTGDYNNYSSLVAAFTGIEKLYLVSSNDLENRFAQHQNVIDAAKEASVKHIIYTSFQRKTQTPGSPLSVVSQSHLDTEAAIVASGLTYTILKHALYADIIPDFAGHQVLENQTLLFPAGEGKTAFATSGDMAAGGAAVLVDDSGKFGNRAVDIAGSQAVSWAEIAAIISKITDKQIRYVSPEMSSYKEALTQAQVPPVFVNMLAGFAQATAEGEFDGVTGELESLIGREPVSVAEYLRTVYGK